MDHSNEIRGIKCEVTNCQYHDKNNCCTAGNIKVGHTYANSTEDTVCETFIKCCEGKSDCASNCR